MKHFTALVCRKIHTQLAKNKLLQGDIHSNNDIKLKKSKKNKVVGNLFAVDDIDIGKKNDIDGNVTAGHKVDNDGDVSGVITENAGVTVVPPPVIATFTTGTLDVEVEKKDTETITPGAFDDVEVDKEGTLNLSSGIYVYRLEADGFVAKLGHLLIQLILGGVLTCQKESERRPRTPWTEKKDLSTRQIAYSKLRHRALAIPRGRRRL